MSSNPDANRDNADRKLVAPPAVTPPNTASAEALAAQFDTPNKRILRLRTLETQRAERLMEVTAELTQNEPRLQQALENVAIHRQRTIEAGLTPSDEQRAEFEAAFEAEHKDDEFVGGQDQLHREAYSAFLEPFNERVDADEEAERGVWRAYELTLHSKSRIESTVNDLRAEAEFLSTTGEELALLVHQKIEELDRHIERSQKSFDALETECTETRAKLLKVVTTRFDAELEETREYMRHEDERRGETNWYLHEDTFKDGFQYAQKAVMQVMQDLSDKLVRAEANRYAIMSCNNQKADLLLLINKTVN